MKSIEESSKDHLSHESYFPRNIADNMVYKAYCKGAAEQKAIDHSEEHLAWITQEFFKWRESDNPKISFGEWIKYQI